MTNDTREGQVYEYQLARLVSHHIARTQIAVAVAKFVHRFENGLYFVSHGFEMVKVNLPQLLHSKAEVFFVDERSGVDFDNSGDTS